MNPALRLAPDDDAKRLPRRFSFTHRALTAIPAPPVERDRVWVYDTKVPALAMQITSNNARAYYVYRKVSGRPVRVRVGGFEELSIEDARRLAAEINLQIASGKDPQQERRRMRAAATLGELFDTFLERYAKPRKRTWKKDQERYNKHLSVWKARRLIDISRQDVGALHARIGKTTPGAANRTLALLSKMFNYAINELGHTGVNPCKGVHKFPEQQRERFLRADELPKLFAALDAELNQNAADALRLCLFTGARSGNVKSMKWEHVSLERGEWTIPASEFKTGKSMTVVLPAPALHILTQRRKAATKDAVYVFPSRGKTGHLAGLRAAWERITETAGIKDAVIHDLRRTLGSWQAAGGASLQVIGKALGHRAISTTTIYARLDLDPVRVAVEQATKAMLAAGSTSKVANSPKPTGKKGSKRS